VKKLTHHHRKPKSLGGIREPRNTSLIPPKKHQAWHLLFSNYAPERIVEEINRLYLDPDYRLIVVRRNP
jgi:hypothetical protein